MHPPLTITAVLACSNLVRLSKAWNCNKAGSRGARSEAASPAAGCDRHAKHFAAAVFGWGKWQAPSVGVDLAELLADEPATFPAGTAPIAGERTDPITPPNGIQGQTRSR
jgi:hypothetical protein